MEGSQRLASKFDILIQRYRVGDFYAITIAVITFTSLCNWPPLLALQLTDLVLM